MRTSWCRRRRTYGAGSSYTWDDVVKVAQLLEKKAIKKKDLDAVDEDTNELIFKVPRTTMTSSWLKHPGMARRHTAGHAADARGRHTQATGAQAVAQGAHPGNGHAGKGHAGIRRLFQYWLCT